MPIACTTPPVSEPSPPPRCAADESPSGAKQAEGEADRAMAWLERAVAAGFTKAPLLAEDHDLDALRQRADFKELLARLSTAQPK